MNEDRIASRNRGVISDLADSIIRMEHGSYETKAIAQQLFVLSVQGRQPCIDELVQVMRDELYTPPPMRCGTCNAALNREWTFCAGCGTPCPADVVRT